MQPQTHQPELVKAWDALANGDFKHTEQFAEAYISAPQPEVKREAHKLLGLCYFQQGNYEKAVEYFLPSVAESQDALDWFNLASAAVLAKQLHVAEKAFRNALECQDKEEPTEDLSSPLLRFYYMELLYEAKEYERALVELEELFRIYSSLETSEDLELYGWGVPFLESTLTTAIKIYTSLHQSESGVRRLDALANTLDEAGAKLVHVYMKKL